MTIAIMRVIIYSLGILRCLLDSSDSPNKIG